MNSNRQFAALETMSRERAALARKEMEYWLAEAEEWKQLREASGPFTKSSLSAGNARQAKSPARDDNG
jgi:hypothetical protein